AALVVFGNNAPERIVVVLAWASVLGSTLQFLVQLPRVLQFLPGFQPVLDTASEHVRTVLRNFGPVFLSRGVVQISAYIDQIIASFLGPLAVSTLGYGQIISTLPVSLFGMSVSAAELPALSSAIGTPDEVAATLRNRMSSALRRIAFFVIPSAVAFLIIGDIVAAAVYLSGKFHYADAVYVWSVLGGSAVGLLASSLGRLYSSAFYALLDTRTPLRFAIVRVLLTTILGYVFALRLPAWLGLDPRWGVAGLTSSAGIAGWLEFALLRRALTDRIGRVRMPVAFLSKLWVIAVFAGVLAFLCKMALGTTHGRLLASVAIPVYGIVYFGGTALMGIKESRAVIDSLYRRLRLT
ncbi:MAG: murein biosynthesis integral membrane protein MurJ, partial [Acidobacteriaceae bacterium]|nr:murein biosynthesis integral membrane protein MurJ [Acidobacteriaceae bacterium]